MREKPVSAELQSCIWIRLNCLRRPIRNAFGGTGQSRRREPDLVPSIATEIAQGVQRQFDVTLGREAASEADVIAETKAALLFISDEMAKQWAGREPKVADKAGHDIAALLQLALMDRFTFVAKPLAPVKPGAQMWCGLAED
ncbi:hypothetical protein [Rhizobium halophytocola]|uniref:Uncharacterized protein n=1 Tax=Rhizobium halophytocola TaxID=735519 RepID=A0ABS4DVJ2_9HYPH|nr:hypothetical protein [Rhizobium halophytocola]MBP1849711.1 hypothetical protein [Rhizobium halophytocola]